MSSATTKAKISILQPIVPHYRNEFFKILGNYFHTSVCCFEGEEFSKTNHFSENDFDVEALAAFSVGPFLFYNPFCLLKKQHKTMVLMLHFGHIATWILLLTKIFHRRKIILWGHGISIKRFLYEQQRPSVLLRLMLKMADGAWFYTENELNLWRKYFPKKAMAALDNTISDVKRILTVQNGSKSELKEKFGIKEPTVIIFCARFTNKFRRIDLLVNLIQQLDSKLFGFIIIGDGPLKPEFSSYGNVYDFGSVYSRSLKNDLFAMSDLYFQPAWVGLSLVEAMAYGKPVFTFKRSVTVLQCVEYFYLEPGSNGKIFTDIKEMVKYLQACKPNELTKMGNAAKHYVRERLTIENMVANAASVVKAIH